MWHLNCLLSMQRGEHKWRKILRRILFRNGPDLKQPVLKGGVHEKNEKNRQNTSYRPQLENYLSDYPQGDLDEILSFPGIHFVHGEKGFFRSNPF